MGAFSILRPRGIAPAPPLPTARYWQRFRRRRHVSLALQGGGAYGAFTWGVLDRLLADERIVIDGISGTSAGALNAVVFAAGWLAGGRDGARAALTRLWTRVMDLAPVNSPRNRSMQQWLEPLLPKWTTSLGFETLTRLMSPQHLNPLDINPLRAVLLEIVDFDRIRSAAAPQLFIAATSLRTGRARVFRNPEITLDVVLASACLPALQRPVKINDESFWDGGYSSNPPLIPLIEHCRARDVLLVQLNPRESEAIPTTNGDILQRLTQIIFNAPMLQELDSVDLAIRLACGGMGSSGRLGRRFRRLRLHRLDATAALGALGPSNMLEPERGKVERLRQGGAEAAQSWLVGERRTIL